MKWGPEADAKLLAAVLRIHQIKLDYGALATAMGEDCTPKALMHRFAKLKDVAKGTASLDNTPGTTPAKRKRGRSFKKTTTGAAENGNDDVDDEEPEATPAKKRGVKRAADANGDDDAIAVMKPRAKRGRKPAVKKEESSTEVEDDGTEDLPLDVEIKIDNGVIKVLGEEVDD